MKPQSISPTSAEVSQTHSQHHVGQQQDSFGNRTAHIADHSLDGQLPGRSWGDVFRDTSRKIGLGTAMMGAGLGLTGFGGVEQRQADAGIVTSFSVDPQIRAFGAQYAVSNGGSVGYITHNNGVASGVYLGNGWVLTAGHVGIKPGALSFGTGTNFNTDPGTIHLPSHVVLHPLYSNLGNHDLALIKYPNLNLSSTLILAPSKPAAGSDVWLAGFGTTGTPAGYTTQDGFIRAGTSRLSNGSGLASEGYSNIYYGAADMRATTRPLDIRGHIGDSGGGVFNQSGELIGIMIAAGNSPSNGRTYFLDLTNTENRSWIQSTTVPEPTSLFLATTGLAAATFSRFRKQER